MALRKVGKVEVNGLCRGVGRYYRGFVNDSIECQRNVEHRNIEVGRRLVLNAALEDEVDNVVTGFVAYYRDWNGFGERRRRYARVQH